MIDRILVTDEGKKIVRRKTIKELLKNDRITRLCGAHDALTAQIVENFGFESIWVSSFETHASCRLPDADILTVSDYSQVCNKIADRVSLPIIMDGDAGGGSPINTIRMVREYEKNGASGISIEDNRYPKRCSFYGGVKRELEDPKVHAMKIRAACDNRISNDFCIIARTEALIVGNGIDDAIYRADAYADAGADAILVHHKGTEPNPIFEFSRRFKRLPLVCVPTTYNTVTEKELYENGYSIVIYANCGIRATVKVIKNILSRIAETGTLSSVEDSIVDMKEIFELIGLEDLQRNEKKYFA